MGERLRVEGEVLDKAAADFNKEANDTTRVLSSINSAVSQMGGSFKGKAGRAFLQYWNGAGRNHTQGIINQLKKLNDKITKINKMVEQSDQETAAMFNPELD
jgi:WXG100 family type VII secretion target